MTRLQTFYETINPYDLGFQAFSKPVTWNLQLKTFFYLITGTVGDKLELMISPKITKTMVWIVGASGRTPIFGRAAARPYNASAQKRTGVRAIHESPLRAGTLQQFTPLDTFQKDFPLRIFGGFSPNQTTNGR
jgi:hypothetical protein